MKKLLLIFGLSLGLSSPALGWYTTGNALYADCKKDAELWKQAICTGYVTAIADMQDAYTISTKSCVPQGATIRQLIDIVMAYFRDNPQTRHAPAAQQVTLALSKAFPC